MSSAENSKPARQNGHLEVPPELALLLEKRANDERRRKTRRAQREAIGVERRAVKERRSKTRRKPGKPRRG